METITVRVELSIGKPVREVFEAALNPVPFFVHKTSGPMKEGAEVMWEFQEMPKGFPIQVQNVLCGLLGDAHQKNASLL